MPIYVVTGANRGLGLEFVRQLAQLPESIIIASVRPSSSDLSDLTRVASKDIHFLECNTGDIKSIKTFASQAKAMLRGKKIDFLINNAGINSVPNQDSLKIGGEDLHEHMRVNVLGPAKTVEFLLAQDMLAPDAKIVNVTSGLASMTYAASVTPRKCATYSISKAALNMLTVHQAGDLRKYLPECVVVCMDPGWVKTRMGGEDAPMEPEDSVGAMLKCIQGLSQEENGQSLDYAGKLVQW